MDRIGQLAEYFDALSRRIPRHGEPTQPWQDEALALVRECFDHSRDDLTPLLHAKVPVAQVAMFVAALRKLFERVGRYSAASNPEIEIALTVVASTLRQISPAPPVPSPLLRHRQQILDFVASYEFRTGKATPVAEVQLEFSASDEHAAVTALEDLERTGLVQLGGTNRNEVHLTRLGTLTCGESERCNELGRRLLSYLRNRLLSERSAFKQYTWDEIKTAGLAAGDSDFPAFERIISIFALHGGGSYGYEPGPTGTWRVPTFVVKLRAIETLEELNAMLVQLWETPTAAPPGRLVDDVAALGELLLSRSRQDESEAPLMFSSEELTRALGWKAPRFNRSMNVLENKGWIDVDPTGGSHPFDARGFELTEEGVLALEAAAGEARQPQNDREASDPGLQADSGFDPQAVRLNAKAAFERFFRSCDRRLNVIPESRDDRAAMEELARKGLALKTRHGAFLIGPRGVDVCMGDANLAQLLGVVSPPEPVQSVPTTVNIFHGPVGAVAAAAGASAQGTVNVQQVDSALHRAIDLQDALGDLTDALVPLLRSVRRHEQIASTEEALARIVEEAAEFKAFEKAVKPELSRVTIAAAKTILEAVPLLKPALALLR